jgi:hypothetical protein
MDPNKKLSVTTLDAPERYDYFIRKICDFEVVWGLFDEGWAAGSVDGTDVIPIWPERELAAECATGDWASLAPREIPLEAFVTKWIPGATADASRFAIFPTPSQKAIVVENATLLADIEAERAEAGEDEPGGGGEGVRSE